MAIPDSIGVQYTNEVALSPRPDQKGLRISVGTTATVPVVPPGEPGDVMTLKVEGEFDIHFLFTKTNTGRADNTCETVFADTKELFNTPKERPFLLSMISPGGTVTVVVNCHPRGT